MNRKNPIGIFDSGVGGTSIWKEINALMPHEDTLFLADSKNAPYGQKPSEEILSLSIKNTELLLAYHCKLIVVACNTATTNAIGYLRRTYNVPFIGIEPAIKPAALDSETGIVGVLATKGTLTSSLFHATARDHASGIKIIEREGKGLVELIEAHKIDSSEMENQLIRLVLPMVEEGMDRLVLGCTHYPYLIPILEKMLPKHIKIIDSGEAVARQTQKVLYRNNLLKSTESKGKHQFFSNSNAEILRRFISNSEANIAYLDF